MNTRRIIYARWLSVAIPLLYFLLWTTTSSTAYPYPRSRNYLHLIEPSPTHEPEDSAALPRPHKLKGPLWCNGTITADPAAGEETYICEGQTVCKGATSCNGPLICTGSWLNDEAAPVCTGDLLCDGTPACNEIIPTACLPGLGIMPNWALGLLLGGLILISGMITGCTAAFTSLDRAELSIYAMEETRTNKRLSEKILWLKTYYTSWVTNCIIIRLIIGDCRVMQGALDLENRVAGDITKPISDVKMLDVKDRMNISRWKEDMVSPDPGEVTTLRSVPIHALPIVPEDYPLWDLLHLFQEGLSHIAVVEKVPRVEPKMLDNIPVNNPTPNWGWGVVWDAIRKNLKFIQKEGDYQQPVAQTPKYWTDSSKYRLSREQPLGIVTMEDVLKTLLRSSIFDEKDISHYGRRRGYGNGSPGRAFESELQSPFTGGSLNNEEIEIESELPAGPAIQLATRNGDESSDRASRRKQNSENNDLSCSKPLIPLSSRDRRRNALTYPLGGTPYHDSPDRLSSKAKGKRKAFEVRKAMSENNYSTNASDDFELESLTGDSLPSSIFSHSTGNTSHLIDLLGLAGEYTNSSDFCLSTLGEASSASVRGT
ncbi:hypothetical protein HOY80DRAFT_1101969 [Tuber brumale]|nr:hypothetical protein HOY80DRAFT_1101969 [Tuber brumale]